MKFTTVRRLNNASNKNYKCMAGEVFVRRTSGLKRAFGALDLLTFVMAWTIGSGILFFTTSVVSAYPGSEPIISLLIDAVVLLFGVLTLWLLSIAVPRLGGQYTWISRIINPTLGYFVTLFVWLGYTTIFGLVSYLGASYVGMALTIQGHLTNSQALISMGKSLSSPAMSVTLAIIFIAIIMVIDMLGYTATRWATYLAFYIPLAILLIAIGALFATPPSIARLAWDKVFGSGAWSEVISLSDKAGWTPSKYLTFNLASTLAAVVPLMSSWSGVSHVGGWFVGEARVPKRSMFWGTIGAYIVAFILMLLALLSYRFSFGYEFVSRLNLVQSHFGIVNSIPLLGSVAMAYYLPPLAILIPYILVLFPIKDLFPNLVAQSRQLFGVAFDRLLPEKLTYVHPRFSSPIIAYLVTGIAIMLFAYLSSPIGIGAYATAGWYVISVSLLNLFTAFAAIVLPFVRPDIYEQAESPANKEIFGVPLISIIGAISFALWFYLLSISIYQTMISPVGPTVMVAMVVVIIVIFLIYLYYLSRLKRLGIPPSLVGKELPPT